MRYPACAVIVSSVTIWSLARWRSGGGLQDQIRAVRQRHAVQAAKLYFDLARQESVRDTPDEALSTSFNSSADDSASRPPDIPPVRILRGRSAERGSRDRSGPEL